jgi:hypothetical protein
LPCTASAPDYKTSDDSVNTLAAVEATLRYYNKIAAAFSTPATPQQARQQIMTAVAELESPLNELTTGLTKMLNHIAGSSAALQKRLFVKVARGLNAYDLLLKRIRSRNLTPISQTDLNANYDLIIKNHPTWGTIAKNNSLGRPTYPDDDDDGGTPPGGPPGGAPGAHTGAPGAPGDRSSRTRRSTDRWKTRTGTGGPPAGDDGDQGQGPGYGPVRPEDSSVGSLPSMFRGPDCPVPSGEVDDEEEEEGEAEAEAEAADDDAGDDQGQATQPSGDNPASGSTPCGR